MLVTRGMPSAREARYGAPPAASRSPRRWSSSVRVTRSMACWLSPRAIIWVKTRRCWSRKKSSGLRFSMAALRALLSRITAPRTERSASRLLGRGFSRVESVGMRVILRFTFAYSNTSPFCRARPTEVRTDATEFFSGGEDYSGLDRFPVCCCVIVERIVRGRGARVNGSGCEFRATRWKKLGTENDTSQESRTWFVRQARMVEVLRPSSSDVLRMTAVSCQFRVHKSPVPAPRNSAQREGRSMLRHYNGKEDLRERGYDSFSTWAFTSAVTSRKIRTVTGYSPRALMYSRSWTWRLSSLKPCAARASAMSAEVTEPKS